MIRMSTAARLAAATTIAALLAAFAAAGAFADPPGRPYTYMPTRQASAWPDGRFGAQVPGHAASAVATHVSRPPLAPSAFDWADAATGSAVTFGVMAALGLAALTARRREGRPS